MTSLADADLWGTAPAPVSPGVTLPAGDPNATVLAPAVVTAPGPNSPVSTAGADPGALSDEAAGWVPGEQPAQPAPAPQPDQGLGFVKHLTHTLGRLNAINPIAMLDPGLAKYQHGAEQWSAGQEAQGKTPGFWGGMAGDVVGSAPSMLLPGGPLVQGGVAGGLTGNSKTLPGLALDAGLGALGGKVGEVVTNGVMNAVAPRISSAVQTLIDNKVPLTTGMLNGNKGLWGRIEQFGQAVPGAGELIRKRGNEALVGFNDAVPNAALAPIGAGVVPGETGHATYQAAKAAMGNAYDGVGAGVQSFPIDGQFGSDMSAIQNRVASLPEDFQRRFHSVLADQIGRRVDTGLGGFTPDALTGAKAAINKEIGQWPEPRGWEADYVGHLKDTRNALTDMMGRSSPEAQAQLAQADAAYPGFKTYQRAVRNSTNNSTTPDGYFTPQQLQSAINTGATQDARAAGVGPLQSLATAGKEILPRRFKDVVSPMQSLIEGGVGAGVVGTDVLGAHAGGLGAGMALASPLLMAPFYTKPVQGVLTARLLKNAATRRALEGLLGPTERYTSPIGGLLGSLGGQSVSSYGQQAALPYFATAQ